MKTLPSSVVTYFSLVLCELRHVEDVYSRETSTYFQPSTGFLSVIKIYLSASYETKGFTCKMEGAGGMVLFSKFFILHSLFWLTSLGF